MNGLYEWMHIIIRGASIKNIRFLRDIMRPDVPKSLILVLQQLHDTADRWGECASDDKCALHGRAKAVILLWRLLDCCFEIAASGFDVVKACWHDRTTVGPSLVDETGAKSMA